MPHKISFESLNGLEVRHVLASSTEGEGKKLFIINVAGAGSYPRYEIRNNKGKVVASPTTLRTATEEYNKL